MTIDMTCSFLGWCAVLNIGLVILWVLTFWLAHEWMHRKHGKMFNISVETFDSIHYAGLAAFKIGIFFFNLVPYLALAIMQ